MPIDIKKDSPEIALKKLKARESVLRQFEDIAGLGSWEVDLKTKKSIWSKRSYEIYGLEYGTDVSIETFFSMALPEYLPKAKEHLERAMQTGETLKFTCKLKRADGCIIDLLINARVIYDEKKQPFKLIGTTQDITEITAIKEEAKELATLLEHSSNEIYVVDMDTLDYLYVNDGACSATGYTKEEFLEMNIRDLGPYLSAQKIDSIKQTLKESKSALTRTIHQRKDGSNYHVQAYIHTLQYKNKPSYVIFDTDITETVKLEEEYKKQAKILQYIHDSVISTDIYGTILTWNKGSENLFGYTKEEIVGKNIQILYAQENESSLDELLSMLNVKNNLNSEITMLKKDTSPVICDVSFSILRDDLGTVTGYIGYIQDITQQKETQRLLEEQTKLLKHQAYHDMLTALPNRMLFNDRLEQAIIQAKRNKQKFALLFIDLDQFKNINDSLGHHIGDEVLIEAANRLSKTIREQDTLSRLGGDEFTIILKDIDNVQNVTTVAQKIISVIKEPISIASHSLYISSSIGISIYPDDTTIAENLVKYADAAMYRAKDEGRDNFQFYSSEMTTMAFEKVVMENSLRIAIKEQQFEVYYQPQYDLKTDKIIGMEALVRWMHPTMGIIPPVKFIPLAETTGLIVEIDRLVMQIAMKQFVAWYKSGLNPGILALNLAMRQLNEDDFISYLLETMNKLQFRPEWLELEVTEGQMMSNPDISIKKLNKLYKLGIEIAIDDFGTGYSSLSYLKKLPLNKLKIDQSFVHDIPDDEDDVAIIKAIIALGRSLNLKLIAEGVETKEQKEFLLQESCDYAQGYFYSKPIHKEEMKKLLSAI